MRKLIAVVLLSAGSFGAGYYLGQRPVGTLHATIADLSKRLEASETLLGDVRHSFKTLSQTALDTTMIIERDFRRRRELAAAQSRLVQAKTDIADRNFGNAAKQLNEAIIALEETAQGTKQDPAANDLLDLTRSLREVRLEVALGKPVPLKKIDDLQRKMDQLLNK